MLLDATIQVAILGDSTVAAPFVGWAKQRYSFLRSTLGPTFQHTAVPADGVRVEWKAIPGVCRIRIWGEAPQGALILSPHSRVDAIPALTKDGDFTKPYKDRIFEMRAKLGTNSSSDTYQLAQPASSPVVKKKGLATYTGGPGNYHYNWGPITIGIPGGGVISSYYTTEPLLFFTSNSTYKKGDRFYYVSWPSSLMSGFQLMAPREAEGLDVSTLDYAPIPAPWNIGASFTGSPLRVSINGVLYFLGQEPIGDARVEYARVCDIDPDNSGKKRPYLIVITSYVEFYVWDGKLPALSSVVGNVPLQFNYKIYKIPVKSGLLKGGPVYAGTEPDVIVMGPFTEPRSFAPYDPDPYQNAGIEVYAPIHRRAQWRINESGTAAATVATHVTWLSYPAGGMIRETIMWDYPDSYIMRLDLANGGLSVEADPNFSFSHTKSSNPEGSSSSSAMASAWRKVGGYIFGDASVYQDFECDITRFYTSTTGGTNSESYKLTRTAGVYYKGDEEKIISSDTHWDQNSSSGKVTSSTISGKYRTRLWLGYYWADGGDPPVTPDSKPAKLQPDQLTPEEAAVVGLNDEVVDTNIRGDSGSTYTQSSSITNDGDAFTVSSQSRTSAGSADSYLINYYGAGFTADILMFVPEENLYVTKETVGGGSWTNADLSMPGPTSISFAVHPGNTGLRASAVNIMGHPWVTTYPQANAYGWYLRDPRTKRSVLSFAVTGNGQDISFSYADITPAVAETNSLQDITKTADTCFHPMGLV